MNPPNCVLIMRYAGTRTSLSVEMMMKAMLIMIIMWRMIIMIILIWKRFNLGRIKRHIELVGAWIFSENQRVFVKTFNKIIVIITNDYLSFNQNHHNYCHHHHYCLEGCQNYRQRHHKCIWIIFIGDLFNLHSCVARRFFPLVGQSFNSKWPQWFAEMSIWKRNAS